MRTVGRSRNGWLIRLCVGAAVIVLLGVVMYFAIWPLLVAGQAQRDHVLTLMEAELERLPSAGGVAEAQRISADEFGRAPTLEVVYPQVEACSAIQTHYAQVASAAGWTPSQQMQTVREVIDSYTKTVSGADIKLVIDCFRDDVAGGTDSGYVLNMIEY